jgi:predicted type IV restriction endonuclease
MTPETTLSPEVTSPIIPVETSAEPQVITTAEEIEGFHIIRAILRPIISSKRIFMRDAQSYCAILLDDNNRKPICRLRFNNVEKLSIGVFNESKEEEKFALESVDDLFNFAEQISATATSHL